MIVCGEPSESNQEVNNCSSVSARVARTSDTTRWAARSAKRRRMVLGQMIGVKAVAVVGLCQAQSLLELLLEAAPVGVHVVEDTKLGSAAHALRSPLTLSYG
jgi:hypothetical protein